MLDLLTHPLALALIILLAMALIILLGRAALAHMVQGAWREAEEDALGGAAFTPLSDAELASRAHRAHARTVEMHTAAARAQQLNRLAARRQRDGGVSLTRAAENMPSLLRQMLEEE